MVRRCVWSRNLVNEGAMAHWGAFAPKTKQIIITIVKKKGRKKSKVQTISTVAGLMAVQSLPNAHSSKPLRMLHERLLSSPSVRRTLWKSVRPSAWLDWTESTHLRLRRRWWWHPSRLTLIFYTLIVSHFATALCRHGILHPNKTAPVLANSMPYCLFDLGLGVWPS